MMNMMPNFFILTDHIHHLLFNGLKIQNSTELLLACIVIGFITFGLEGTRVLFLYWETRVRQHPLTYGQTDTHHKETTPLISSLLIPSSIESIRKRRLKYHCLAFLTHIINVVIAYLIMLAVMSYNAWIGISVLCGSGLGHFIFASLKYKIQLKYPASPPQLSHRNTSASLQINSVNDTPESSDFTIHC